MEAIDPLLITTLNYYLREKYFGTALNICEEILRRKRDDSIMVLMKSYCLTKLGKPAEAIRLLGALKKTSTLSLSSSCTLKVAYSSEAVIDRDSLKEVELEINKFWSSSDNVDVYLAIIILTLEGTYDRARSLLDRLSSANPENSAFLALRGWLDVFSGRDSKTALKNFDAAIRIDNLPEGFFGKAKVFEERHNANDFRATVNELLDEHSTLVPAYIEMIRATIMSHDWEKANELTQNASLIQNDCIPILLYECAYLILVQGDMTAVEQALSELFETVSKVEKDNHLVNYKIAKFLSSVSLDNPSLMQYSRPLEPFNNCILNLRVFKKASLNCSLDSKAYTRKFLERALSLSKKMDYLAEKSRILVASGDVKQAMQVTVNAVETSSESNTSALLAVIRCHIAQGDIGDAKAQMDFLKATHENIEKSVLFYYFQALIDKAENKPEESFLSNMRHAIDAHISSLQKIPFGLDYIIQLDACFLIEIATQLLDYAPIAPTKAPDVILKEISRILNIVHENCPGLTKANYLLAKAKFLEMDIDGAEMLLRSCIERNNSLAEVHLLLAQIYLQKQNLEEAAKCLDVGLSFNFKVREHPRYFLIRSKMLKRQKQIDQAIAMLKSALSLPIFSADQQSLKQMDVSESERIAVYLELMDSLQLVGRIHEADSVMQQAVSLYTGKPEEHQLVLMNAQLRLQRGDVDGSLGVLQSVRPDQPNYQAARMKMAQIYLEEKHDRHRFSICYRDILDHDPTPQAYVLLGDAYMSIQEPTKAIEAYETAMRRNPKDHALAEKIGNAYVQCHLYNKAITFYEAAMKSGRQNVMRLRFAEQLFRMGNLEKCERVLREIVDKEGDPMDVQSIKDHVAYWMLLSKLHFENGNWQEATSDLLKAKSLQSKMLTKSALEVPNMQEERKLAANICCQLAELHSNRREWNKATELYKEAVLINDHDIKSMLALASIYMSMGKLQQCNQQCQTILSLDRNNNEATLGRIFGIDKNGMERTTHERDDKNGTTIVLMMADLMYQRNEGEQAIKHFSQILDRNPNQYHALARCVELSWRKGDMEQVDKYLKNAVENNPRATVDAGYNYCKGLLEWYTGEPNAALQAFNRARRDLEWGERAIYNMIEICLNPDNEIIGGEVFDHSEDPNDESEREIGTKTAERFLKELRYKPGLDYKYKLMENFILLSSSNKANVQQALNNFLEMVGTETTIDGDKNLNVGAILGSARAYMILKQTQKAKAQLKRVINYPWSLEDADYLEQCWLLLADLYINQGKSDQATNVLRTVLQYNASAIKAFEYMGFLRERDQKFADAASNYEAAWKLCKQRNPAIGYKLAYNYLKCRKLFDCIEICHAVLGQYPNYPKIKKEVMDKARAAIRT